MDVLQLELLARDDSRVRGTVIIGDTNKARELMREKISKNICALRPPNDLLSRLLIERRVRKSSYRVFFLGDLEEWWSRYHHGLIYTLLDIWCGPGNKVFASSSTRNIGLDGIDPALVRVGRMGDMLVLD